MRGILLLAGVAPLLFAVPAMAQTDHSNMPGMQMPAPKKPVAKPKPRPGAKPVRRAQPKPASSTPAVTPAAPAPAADPHAGHGMPTTPGTNMPGMQSPPAPGAPDPHAGHDMSAMPGMPGGDAATPHGTGGTALPAGNAPTPAPPPPSDHYADRVFPPEEMARARGALTREHGGTSTYQVMLNLAEYQVRRGRDGYRLDGEAWFGEDINRLTLKSEGEGSFGSGVDSAEVQVLYSRALDPYWNLQAGVRQDFQPGPARTYATIGIEGVAPYWFDVEGALFLSDKGDLLARASAYYDQRITQRLILQPRLELNFAAQDMPRNGIGSGLSNAELGMRLRYEVAREFAPYMGVSWERKFGNTADYARLRGEETGGFSFVLGVRSWF